MCMFAVGNMLLKFRRSTLRVLILRCHLLDKNSSHMMVVNTRVQADDRASMKTVLFGLLAVMLAFIATIVKQPSIIPVFALFFMIVYVRFWFFFLFSAFPQLDCCLPTQGLVALQVARVSICLLFLREFEALEVLR